MADQQAVPTVAELYTLLQQQQSQIEELKARLGSSEQPRAAALGGAEPFIGEIALLPYNFAPEGWALCNGQLLSIAENTALFSLLGTTYGGDGRVTFALPDLRGRSPVSSGQAPGMDSYLLGEQGGEETVTLTVNEMPVHNHAAACYSADANQRGATGNVWATEAANLTATYSNAAPDSAMAGASIGASGGSQPHDNRSPYLTLNYCIALSGIYPSRG